jgi:hypothetical protein
MFLNAFGINFTQRINNGLRGTKEPIVPLLHQKADYQKACNYLIGETIDLELIYQDHSVASDLEKIVGVKRGIAQRVVGMSNTRPRSTNKLRHRIK